MRRTEIWRYVGVLVVGIILGVWLAQVDWTGLLPIAFLRNIYYTGGSKVIIGVLATISVIAGVSFIFTCLVVLRRNRVK